MEGRGKKGEVLTIVSTRVGCVVLRKRGMGDDRMWELGDVGEVWWHVKMSR